MRESAISGDSLSHCDSASILDVRAHKRPHFPGKQSFPRYNCCKCCQQFLPEPGDPHVQTHIQRSFQTSGVEVRPARREETLPEEKKYPINDKAHAQNAKARASEMEHQGKISAATKAQIDRASDRVIREGT